MTTWAEHQAARAAAWAETIGRPELDVEDAVARIVLAVASGARTFRDVEARTGITLSSAHKYACIARRRGLIDWDAQHSATLRTTLDIVAHTPADRIAPLHDRPYVFCTWQQGCSDADRWRWHDGRWHPVCRRHAPTILDDDE